MKNIFLFFALISNLFPAVSLAGNDPVTPENDFAEESSWVAPPPPNDSGRTLKFTLQAAFQKDPFLNGVPFSFFDVSAKRNLDENSVFADGLFRLTKNFSVSDAPVSLEIRTIRLSYLESWLQLTAGRFDLFQHVTPNAFFGAYPLMGIHRVDGVWGTIPFSFLFKFGSSKEGDVETSSPVALSFFYTPTLFSNELAQYDGTQSFCLGQVRLRANMEEFACNLRLNAAYSGENFFAYSSLNGGYSYSVAVDMNYQQNYVLTAEYGVQNAERSMDTNALAIGFQGNHLGTWGAFSIDQIALEGQFPLARTLANPFTGGNAFVSALAQLPQTAWYGKIRARVKVLFVEFHLTNSRNDFTFGRLVPSAVAVPFTGNFGPGNETNGAGIPLCSSSYDNISYLAQMGVEF
jgi:hypothetical protein